jgi:type IV secretory pathway VirB2 component (pilin)
MLPSTSIKFDSRFFIQLSINLLIVAIVLLLANNALAGATGGEALSGTLTKVVCELTGTTGKAIATLAIVAMGMGLFVGKLSWGVAAATSVGVGMLFAAPKVVSWLSASAELAACPA